MKKLNINKSAKITFVLVNLVLIGLISFFLYNNIYHPGIEEKKVALYKYNNQASINHEVFLKPNLLYDSKSLGPGIVYITEIVDYIDATFNYRFQGERAAELKADYEILAVIEGYQGQEETYKTIWKKGYVLLPKVSIGAKNKDIVIKETIPINLAEYNNFVKEVLKSIKISSNVKLSIMMNINIKANTDKGLIEEKLSPNIIIPLETNYFEITGDLLLDKPGSIEETKQVQLPVNQSKVMGYGILVGLLFIILIFLLFFTKGIVITEPLKKQLNKIFKAHGSRLVAINNEIGTSFGMYYKVKSIEDLVRIADELGKPIMYKYSNDSKEITNFYIHDDKSMYSFNLKDLLADLDADKLEAEKIILDNPGGIPLE